MKFIAICPLILFVISSVHSDTIHIPADQQTVQAGISAASMSQNTTILFSEIATITTSALPHCVVVGRLGPNSDLSAIVCSFDADNTVLYQDTGDGQFRQYQILGSGNNPYDMRLADFNSDGFQDVVVAYADIAGPNGNGKKVTIYLNDGTGTFFPGTDYSFSGQPMRLTVQDVNNDHNPDIIVCTYGEVDILLGDGLGAFNRGQIISGGTYYEEVVCPDLDHDGDCDLVVMD